MTCVRWITALTAATLGFAACSIEGIPGLAGDEPAPDVTLSQSDEPVEASATADIVERVLPAVVNVKVRSAGGCAGNVLGGGQGEGSGVVIDRAGVILTNYHVVEGAIDVEIVFNDEHERQDGEVVGFILERDLAVIQVEADDLTEIELGRSSGLRLGDDVVAIGFPLGLGGPTVTKGIISATERDIEASAGTRTESLEGLLQTDAAINPGNSGGALVDAAGRLVGINTAAAGAASAENVGFAIPIDDALPVIEEILSEPPEERGWLGVTISSVNSAALAIQLGLDADVRGVLVEGLLPDSPAGDGGIEPGHVITAVGGSEIASAEDLTRALADLRPGSTVSVEVATPDGGEAFTVELGQRPVTCPP